MYKFQSEQEVNLGRIVPFATQMAFDDGFKLFRMQIRTGKRAGIEQHVTDITGQRIAIPDPEMGELVTTEKKTFEM